jgi:ABC-2 type transport system permease protein
MTALARPSLLALESRWLLRSRLALAVLAVLAIAVVAALANGRALLAAQMASRASAAAELSEADSKLRAGMARGMPAADAVLLPIRVRLPVIAPLPPLLDASAGQAMLMTDAGGASLRSRADTLFARTTLENPELLMRGGLDLGFVVLVIAPLLLVALGHGLVAADRDSGALRLVLAQGGGVGRLLLARSLPRLALVIGPVLLALLWLGLIGPDLPGRTTALVWWGLIALASLILWWALVLLINSLRAGADAAALALVAIWALFTLVLPPLVTALVGLAQPLPSRYAVIAQARAAEVAATAQWDNDHAESVSDEVASRRAAVVRTVDVNGKIAAATAPIIADHARRRAERQARLDQLALLAPPMLAAQALAQAAGSDTTAGAAFQMAAGDFVDRLRAALSAVSARPEPMTVADLDRLPRFAAPRPQPMPVAALAWLLGLAAVLAAAAARNLSRLQPD